MSLMRIAGYVPHRFVPIVESAYCCYYSLGDSIKAEPHVPPLPPARLRCQVGSVKAGHCLAVGEQCLRDVTRGVALSGKDFASLRSILDFGCGCGRTLRWLTGSVDSSCRLYGTDANGEAIDWCRTALRGVQ